ncbi:thioredoxin family protein [Staphylococcus canis]|uniref:Thioredoxin family protein n=1 Tax=Staphylococcus canis TaxID=2724942 RepID=A0ABS0T8L7_9STAP|nr:thioredoxin family protein [Staphylococcus canis]MBI5974104.1 thioredoxin family protein [Staphylococcus canis]
MNVSKQLNNIYKYNDEPIHLIFGYTPMCGTCKMSERMLDIANEMTQLPLVKADLNFHPEFSKEKEIQSVPVLLIMKKHQEVERVYAFRSVTNIVEILKKYVDES